MTLTDKRDMDGMEMVRGGKWYFPHLLLALSMLVSTFLSPAPVAVMCHEKKWASVQSYGLWRAVEKQFPPLESS